MRRIFLASVTLCAALLYFAPGSRALMSGVAYTDFANVFTANQRINAGLGINVAPGSTGTVSASGGIFERSRSTAIGEWTDVAYASGNFTASGSMAVTVDSADQITYAYTMYGKTMHVALVLDAISVGGTPDLLVRVAVPGGVIAARKHQNSCFLLDSAGGGTGTGVVEGFVRVLAGGTVMEIGRADGTNLHTSTNNTYIRVDLEFSVQ